MGEEWRVVWSNSTGNYKQVAASREAAEQIRDSKHRTVGKDARIEVRTVSDWVPLEEKGADRE